MSVRDRIRQIFSEKLHFDPPEDDADLIEGGILDSLMLVELLLNIEQSFGVKVNLETLEAENFRSIDRIAKLVEASSSPDAAEVA